MFSCLVAFNTSPYFLTFLQAKELGGHFRKGEKGSLVIKYGTYTKETEGELPKCNASI